MSYLALMNFGLGAFNLVPAFPLDGGRVLRAILWKFTSKVNATRIASAAGGLFAYLFIFNGIWGLLQGAGVNGLWSIMIGWFLKSASAGAYAQVRFDAFLSGIRVRDLMVTDYKVMPGHLSISEATHDYFFRYGYGGFPVSDGSSLTGILSLSDIKGVPQEDWLRTSVQSVMSRLDERSSIGAEQDVVDALSKMAASGLGRLIVLDEARRPVGLVTHNGILRRLQMQEQLGG